MRAFENDYLYDDWYEIWPEDDDIYDDIRDFHDDFIDDYYNDNYYDDDYTDEDFDCLEIETLQEKFFDQLMEQAFHAQCATRKKRRYAKFCRAWYRGRTKRKPHRTYNNRTKLCDVLMTDEEIQEQKHENILTWERSMFETYLQENSA